MMPARSSRNLTATSQSPPSIFPDPPTSRSAPVQTLDQIELSLRYFGETASGSRHERSWYKGAEVNRDVSFPELDDELVQNDHEATETGEIRAVNLEV